MYGQLMSIIFKGQKFDHHYWWQQMECALVGILAKMMITGGTGASGNGKNILIATASLGEAQALMQA